jgi:hypothetical protein
VPGGGPAELVPVDRLRRRGYARDPGTGGHVLKEVTCMCGWQTRGTADEVVDALQRHGDDVHGRRPTREEILALAVDLGEPTGDAGTL